MSLRKLSWQEFTPKYLSPNTIKGLKTIYKKIVIEDTLYDSFQNLVLVTKERADLIAKVLKQSREELIKFTLNDDVDIIIKYYEDLAVTLDGEEYSNITLDQIEMIPGNIEMWLDDNQIRDYLNPNNLVNPEL